MPKHLSLDTVIDKNKIESTDPFLMLLEIDVVDMATGLFEERLYYVHNDEDITYQGQVYVRAIFDFKITEAAEEIPQVTLNLVDHTGSVLSKCEERNGGIGWKIRFKYISTANIAQPPEMEELVYVKSTKASEYRVDFTLGARNPLSQRFPRRLQWRDRCSWIYKSVECGYDGAISSCDYSLNGSNGCSAHNNTKRFGGFPGIRPR